MADDLIKPHGSDTLNPLYVFDDAKRAELLKEAESLPSIVVCSQAAANAVMLGGGYFNPLKGYMDLEESLKVAEKMETRDGLFWPVPIVNVVKDPSPIKDAKRIALRDPNVEGNPVLAIQDVERIDEATDEQMTKMAEQIFGTTDMKHPGVSVWMDQGRFFIAGPIQVLSFSYFEKEFPETFCSAERMRELIKERGWKRVVAFQTRNPMHRAHEGLVKMAMEAENADGAVIHMLLGKLKKGDIPADVRDACIRIMVDKYFPPNSALITGYGFDMLYAGPREALLHAIFRQNMGATCLITGRDHAGVGDYYGPFDAQTIFDEIPKDALKINIYRGDHTVWCNKCQDIVMIRDCPHSQEDYLMLSGTRTREILSNGEYLPPEFSRPEVAEVLMDYYRNDPRAKA
ncbi:MAG: sulfate adenylyltransferase [Dehalococcoidia bacterium]